MASKAFLKALRKKNKLGEFAPKHKKKSTSKRTIKRKSTNNMARRKTKTRVVYRKAPRRRSKSRGNADMNVLVGLGGYALVENTIDNFAAGMNLGIPTNILQAGAGYFLKKKGGVIGHVGKAMFYVNGYQVAKDIIGGGFNFGAAQANGGTINKNNW